MVFRAVYRVAELADGWTGRIIRTQVYFSESIPTLPSSILTEGLVDVLDATMVVIVMFATNIFHPGRLLATEAQRPEDRLEANAQSSETESV